MHTLEQIEEEVRLLPVVEQKALLAKLANLVAKGGEFLSETPQKRLTRFFAEWDAGHSVTVGEIPTRSRTYADNPRLCSEDLNDGQAFDGVRVINPFRAGFTVANSK